MSEERSFTVLDGKLVVTDDTKLELVMRRGLSFRGGLLVAAGILVGLWCRYLAERGDGSSEMIVWGLVAMGLFGVVEPLGVARSRFVVPRRTLRIERASGAGYRERGAFAASVDGRPLGPTRRRALYEIRHAGFTLSVVVLASDLIVLCRGHRYGQYRSWTEESRATTALLRADRGFYETYGRESIVPLVQAAARVLDLSPPRPRARSMPESSSPQEGGQTARRRRSRPASYSLRRS